MAIMHLGMQSVPKTADTSTIAVGTTPIYVNDSGNINMNGTYSYVSGTKYKIAINPYYLNRVGSEWWITTSTDSIKYYYNTGGDASNIPKAGWQLGTEAAPAPTISA